jgi:predicted TIM-barrel fold metal-dependent hydrolase
MHEHMSSLSAADVRRRLGHPVIDADGHSLEFLPAVRDHLRELAGEGVARRLDEAFATGRMAKQLTVDRQRALGLFRMTWWGFPAERTLDRATALLPRLLYERLDELGIDFAFVYPTFGLLALSLDEPELRCAFARAFNAYYAEAYAGLGDRLCHAALVPMHEPEEAIAELEHATGALGLRACVFAGQVLRPLPGAESARGARWLDLLDEESPRDYDPVWRRCEQLGVAPTFHSSAMGWGSRRSLSSYVKNHLGNFAAAGEAACRALFLGGVPQRFPRLRFAFLEGGVAWAASLRADLAAHLEKRGPRGIASLDPRALDRAELRRLFERYAPKRFALHAGELDAALAVLSDPDEDRAGLNEFARAGVETAEDVCAVFERFHFGCEADDPLITTAFTDPSSRALPDLHAILGSDIGHWDVPDVGRVLPEAFELLERGRLSAAQLRAFLFENPVRLFAGARPGFFEGTRVAEAARAVGA